MKLIFLFLLKKFYRIFGFNKETEIVSFPYYMNSIIGYKKPFLNQNQLSFLEVKITNSKIKKLPRPINLIKIKKEFMN